MTVGELVHGLRYARLDGDPHVVVHGISHDSRQVRRGWIFAALPGQRAHGIDFVGEAVVRGAVAVLSDRPKPEGHNTPWIASSSPRVDMAGAALRLAGDPQRELTMVAVTGTNGKSTTAHLISRMFQAAGQPAAFFGTLGYFLPDGGVESAERTTPEVTDLARLLRRTIEHGGRAAVMEASSHALVQHRLAGIRFHVAVWTNLSRDHLDYHGDMESYFQAKRTLFEDHLTESGRRVLPLDDPWGSKLLDDPMDGDISWGLANGQVHARAVKLNLEGARFELLLPDGAVPVQLRLIGMHNVRNAIAAAAAGHAAGLSSSAICRGLEGAEPLAGRLERVAPELPFPVLVDFAHTPDGLRSVLETVRQVSDRRLIVVFGAGGDRDIGKRGPMGAEVGAQADVAIVTSDNPRSEDPTAIAAAVADGVRSVGGDPLVVLDRREAIRRALDIADENSLVLVAGKGHESTQTIGDRRIPFSDQQVVRELAGGGS